MRLAITTFALAVMPLAACGQGEEDATTGTPAIESEAAPIGLDPAADTPPEPSPETSAGATAAPTLSGNTPVTSDGSVDPEAVGEPYQDYVGETN